MVISVQCVFVESGLTRLVFCKCHQQTSQACSSSFPQELFPANKRSCDHFSKYFTDAGLKELSDFARNQQSIGARKELQKELQEQMSRGDSFKEVNEGPLAFEIISPTLPPVYVDMIQLIIQSSTSNNMKSF